MKNKLQASLLGLLLIGFSTNQLSAQSGRYPTGGLIESNEKLYGLTSNGGQYGAGALYEYDIASGNVLTKLSFDDYTTGREPSALMKATDGSFYGASALGATSNRGVFFKYDVVGNTFTSIVHFANAGLKFPQSQLIQVGNKIYGTTQYNDVGSYNDGSLYIYDITTQSFDVIHLANSPAGGLTLASDGNLYGLAHSGGSANLGSIYQLNLTNNTVTIKANFTVFMPSNWPYGHLTEDAHGNLWGVSESFDEYIDGTVFKYNISSETISEVLEFNFWDYNLGECIPQPAGDLEMLPNGKVYGMSYNGGSSCQGTLFEYVPSTTSYSVKFEFNGSNGSAPNSLMRSVSRRFYGTTDAGGAYDYGTIFSYNLVTNTFEKLYDFGSPSSFKTLSVASDKSLSFTVFPNPASDKITISSLNFTVSEKLTYTIIDLQGCTVKNSTMSNVVFPLDIDLSEIPQGVYMLQIADEDNSNFIKIIKTQ